MCPILVENLDDIAVRNGVQHLKNVSASRQCYPGNSTGALKAEMVVLSASLGLVAIPNAATTTAMHNTTAVVLSAFIGLSLLELGLKDCTTVTVSMFSSNGRIPLRVATIFVLVRRLGRVDYFRVNP